MAAGTIALVLGSVEGKWFEANTAWKKMFLIGAIPALICFFVQLRLKEPEKWVKARELGKTSGVRFGSYLSLFGEARWRGPAIFGMILCVAGIIGLWGVGFFSPELVSGVIHNSLVQEGVPAADIPGKTTFWIGLNMILQNAGSFIGMLVFAQLAQRFGRKPAFAGGFICAFIATVSFFTFFNSRTDVFWLSPIMGFCQLALFAGFAIYLPELFPTRLRSTGTSFCYNVGRFVAATGPWTLGALKVWLAPPGADTAAKFLAFRHAACYLSGIFFLGLVALIFLPETKGQPLPEDLIEGELPEPA
jgi:MFS family permease